jgi:hypothetical protein
MRANRHSILLPSFLILAVLTFVACGTGGSAASAPAGGEGFGVGGAPAASAAPDEQPVPPDQVGQQVDDAKIVRTGEMELEVLDVTAALTSARDGIQAMGGYIGASDTQTYEDTPLATVTYRIPVDRWEGALDLLRGLTGGGGKVLTERTNAVEVTGAIVDLEARIRNLRTSEAALQDIASRATRISDVLEVQAQLTTVRGQIEQLTAQLTRLEDQAAYATLTASFSAPVVAVQVAAESWEPAKVVDQATASLVDILQALTTAGIWFAIVWLPLLIVTGIVVAVVVGLLRRFGVIGPRRRADVPAAS